MPSAGTRAEARGHGSRSSEPQAERAVAQEPPGPSQPKGSREEVIGRHSLRQFGRYVKKAFSDKDTERSRREEKREEGRELEVSASRPTQAQSEATESSDDESEELKFPEAVDPGAAQATDRESRPASRSSRPASRLGKRSRSRSPGPEARATEPTEAEACRLRLRNRSGLGDEMEEDMAEAGADAQPGMADL